MSSNNILKSTLIADNKDFVQKIEQSQKKLYDFKKSNQGLMDTFKSNISTFTKFAGTIGGAFAVLESFKQGIESTQATADTFNTILEQSKSVTNEFFQTIASGDWSNLLTNLETAITRGKEYAQIIDTLGDRQFAFNIKENDRNREKNKLIDIINTSKNKDERKKAYEDLLKIHQERKKDVERLENTQYEAFNKALLNSIGGDINSKAVSDKQLKQIFQIYTNNQGGTENSINKAFREKIEKLLKDQYATPHGMEYQGYHSKEELQILNQRRIEADFAKREIARLKKQNPVQYYATIAINNITDNERQELEKLHIERGVLSDKITQEIKELNKLYLKVEKGALNIDSSTNIHKPQKSKKNKIVKEVELTKQSLENLSKIDFDFHFDTIFDRSTKYIQKLNSEIDELLYKQKNLVLGSDEWSKVQRDIDNKKEEINNVKKLTIPNLPLPLPTEKKDGENDNKFDIENVEKYTQAISNLASAFSYLNQQQENSLSSFLSYTSNVLGSIGKVIASFQALAISKSVSSTAEIPFLGIINAVASVAQLTAIFSSLPKFANGGIVSSGYTSGDFGLARVNKGEMILNTTQQTRLFNLLNGGAINNNNHLSAEVKIKGSDLHLALSNYKNLNKL